jgi:hypothetical protein
MDINFNLKSLKNLENEENEEIKVKMILLYNSIEQGWCVKKKGVKYIFTKQHENKKEVLEDSYLIKFMKENLDINKIIS